MQAALPLFARKGYAETTTKDLARAAGVSEPLLYKHFPSKEALYAEIQNQCCQGKDPTIRKLTHLIAELEPSTSSLVHLVYYFVRVQVLGKPVGAIEWETLQRLMLKSFLEDGAFARTMHQNRFNHFCERIEACLEAAVAAGDAVKTPLSPGNNARFAHHLRGVDRPGAFAEKAGDQLQSVARGTGSPGGLVHPQRDGPDAPGHHHPLQSQGAGFIF